MKLDNLKDIDFIIEILVILSVALAGLIWGSQEDIGELLTGVILGLVVISCMRLGKKSPKKVARVHMELKCPKCGGVIEARLKTSPNTPVNVPCAICGGQWMISLEDNYLSFP